MFSHYAIYFSTLSKAEKLEQALILTCSFVIFFIICGILYFLKTKFLDNTKNSRFQKFLKKL